MAIPIDTLMIILAIINLFALGTHEFCSFTTIGTIEAFLVLFDEAGLAHI